MWAEIVAFVYRKNLGLVRDLLKALTPSSTILAPLPTALTLLTPLAGLRENAVCLEKMPAVFQRWWWWWYGENVGGMEKGLWGWVAAEKNQNAGEKILPSPLSVLPLACAAC